jgi:hypothetical protein
LEEVRNNLAVIQALAMWKYDAYERFSHGMRFVESLALWLGQFETPQERQTAFDFVRSRLVFFSEAEMNHLVEMAYPDFIRPHLLQRMAVEPEQPPCPQALIAACPQFLIRQRQCLFLGLSDGARTDVFRRSNSEELSNEQILLTYEVEEGRAAKLLEELKKSLKKLTRAEVPDESAKFRTAVLLDDFSASGRSYLRLKGTEYVGKIGGFYNNLFKAESGTSALFEVPNLEVFITLYAATRQAREHLQQHMKLLWDPQGIPWKLMIVHELDDDLRVQPRCGHPMEPLIEKYYDKAIQDEHTDVGGTDVKYGFAQCGLPVVLPHNTPNNSLALLWAEVNETRALFPRVQRHRKQS